MDEDQSRGTQLLEIYALEIQMHNETKNYKKLKVFGVLSLIGFSISCKHSPGDLQCLQ